MEEIKEIVIDRSYFKKEGESGGSDSEGQSQGQSGTPTRNKTSSSIRFDYDEFMEKIANYSERDKDPTDIYQEEIKEKIKEESSLDSLLDSLKLEGELQVESIKSGEKRRWFR